MRPWYTVDSAWHWNMSTEYNSHSVVVHNSTQWQWRIQKFWKGGSRQFVSPVLIYRKCAQRNICVLDGKIGFLRKIWANRERPPPPHPFLIRHCLMRVYMCMQTAYCGGVLDARFNGTIYSPGYPSPGYRQDVHCSWLIKVNIHGGFSQSTGCDEKTEHREHRSYLKNGPKNNH